MHTTPIPTDPSLSAETQPKPAKRIHLPNLYGWLFVAFASLVLVIFLVPFSSSVGVRSSQTRTLAQAKTIGLALKLFAGDNDGVYPRQGIPIQMLKAPANSNEAFACLFPTYLRSETIFGNKLSAYQTGSGPDNVIDETYTGQPKETLRPGENTYAYVTGLSDAVSPNAPLVLDGTADTLHYVSDPKKHGGAMAGTRAVVIRLDNSGALENLTGPPDARLIVDRDHPAANLLDVSKLGSGVQLLNPAVTGHATR